MGVAFLGGLGPLTPKNNGWCCDRDEGGVNRVRGSVYRWLGVPYTIMGVALTRALRLLQADRDAEAFTIERLAQWQPGVIHTHADQPAGRLSSLHQQSKAGLGLVTADKP